MLQCPFDGNTLIRARGEIKTVGEGWTLRKAFIEHFICPRCGFAIAQHSEITDIGRSKYMNTITEGKNNVKTTSNTK
jgi:hypothetical protein